jgi:cytochrome b
MAANLIFACAVLHVMGAVVESVRHRENLILSMITGRKRAPNGSDVIHAPMGLGGQ